MSSVSDPHRGQPVLTLGPAPKAARLTMIMAHGRGASAEDMLGLAAEFHTDDVAFLAPQAAGRTWYPYSFLSPIAGQRAWDHLGARRDRRRSSTAWSRSRCRATRIALLGFSQGACLALEFAARHPAALRRGRRPQRRPDRAARHAARLSRRRSRERRSSSAAATSTRTSRWPGCRSPPAVFRRMGATVDERIYPRMGHTVNEDEVDAVRALLLSNLRHASAT